MISVYFSCGHPPTMWQDGDGDPRCPLCGDRKIARVSAPPPRITGAVILPGAAPAREAQHDQ